MSEPPKERWSLEDIGIDSCVAIEGEVLGLRFVGANAAPPNYWMELTGKNRHTLCKEEEQRVRRFSPAAHPGR